MHQLIHLLSVYLCTLFPYSDLIRLECLRYWSAEKCSVVCGEHLSLFGKFFLKQTFREMPSIIKNKNRSGGGIHTTESLPCFKNNLLTNRQKYLEMVSIWRYLVIFYEKIHHERYQPLWESVRESHHRPNACSWLKSMSLFFLPLQIITSLRI